MPWYQYTSFSPDKVKGSRTPQVGLDVSRGATLQQIADHGHLLRPDRRDQRSEPDRSRLHVDECTGIQQQPRNVHHSALGGEVECGGAHGGVDRVNVSTRGEQFADHRRRAPTRGNHERRKGQWTTLIDVHTTSDELVYFGQIVRFYRRQQGSLQVDGHRLARHSHLQCGLPAFT